MIADWERFLNIMTEFDKQYAARVRFCKLHKTYIITKVFFSGELCATRETHCLNRYTKKLDEKCSAKREKESIRLIVTKISTV